MSERKDHSSKSGGAPLNAPLNAQYRQAPQLRGDEFLKKGKREKMKKLKGSTVRKYMYMHELERMRHGTEEDAEKAAEESETNATVKTGVKIVKNPQPVVKQQPNSKPKEPVNRRPSRKKRDVPAAPTGPVKVVVQINNPVRDEDVAEPESHEEEEDLSSLGGIIEQTETDSVKRVPKKQPKRSLWVPESTQNQGFSKERGEKPNYWSNSQEKPGPMPVTELGFTYAGTIRDRIRREVEEKIRAEEEEKRKAKLTSKEHAKEMERIESVTEQLVLLGFPDELSRKAATKHKDINQALTALVSMQSALSNNGTASSIGNAWQAGAPHIQSTHPPPPQPEPRRLTEKDYKDLRVLAQDVSGGTRYTIESCKKALQECRTIDAATLWLLEKGKSETFPSQVKAKDNSETIKKLQAMGKDISGGVTYSLDSCKNALLECEDSLDNAVMWLLEKGEPEKPKKEDPVTTATTRLDPPQEEKSSSKSAEELLTLVNLLAQQTGSDPAKVLAAVLQNPENASTSGSGEAASYQVPGESLPEPSMMPYYMPPNMPMMQSPAGMYPVYNIPEQQPEMGGSMYLPSLWNGMGPDSRPPPPMNYNLGLSGDSSWNQQTSWGEEHVQELTAQTTKKEEKEAKPEDENLKTSEFENLLETLKRE